MKTPHCCLFLLCYVYSLSSFSQTIIHDYLLGSTSNIEAANGRFYDNGGKDGDIRNEHFITTLHGVKNIEIYFEKYKLPDGSLLKAYLGNDTLAPLVAAFHSYDKIWNIQGKDVTLEYVPPVNNITTAMGFEGVVHEVPPPPPSPEGDGSRSQPASDCVGAIPLCQNTTAVALAGQYTDLGAVNDDNGSCY